MANKKLNRLKIVLAEKEKSNVSQNLPVAEDVKKVERRLVSEEKAMMNKKKK